MKTLSILLLVVILTAGRITAANSLGGSLSASSAVHFTFESWRGDAKVDYEYAQLRDGSWWSFRDRDGLTGPAAANVTAWAQSILDMQAIGAFQLDQPLGLDLNSADDTATTVGHTPVDFCADILFDSGATFRVCVDRTADGAAWAMVDDADFHRVGFAPVDPVSVDNVWRYLPG